MRNKTSLSLIVSVVALLTIFPIISSAQVPQTMNHQGYLTDSTGTPIDGSVSITFSLYDVATSGTALWSQTQTVTVNQGVYSIVLGGGANPQPLSLPFDTQYWLGVKVGTDSEMTPRQALTSVPYALSADVASYAVTANQMLCNKYEFVGFSTGMYNGGMGIFDNNQLCQADFPNSRMCTTDEIIKTINIPLVSGSGWVNPIIVLDGGSYYDSATGIGRNYYYHLNCYAWGSNSSASNTGMSVNSNGRFAFNSCGNSIPIACCSPAP